MLPQVLFSARPSVCRFLVSKARSLTIVSAMLFAGSLAAQTASSSTTAFHAPADRLTQPIVETNRVVLEGTMHPLANKANDRGAVGDGMKLDRIQVVLKRSDAQEAALQQLIGEMHQKGSANYHKWLTPDDFGKQFGPSDADVAKLESWLGSHGFSITKLNPGRQTLEIAGTAGQFRDTFHAQIHSYQVKGVAGALETHFANSAAPEIPAALAPVFGGFASLNNFHLKSHAHVLGKAQYNPSTHESTPEWTRGTSSGYSLVLAPADFAVQYDLTPLYAAGTNGTNQSIAIVNEANINIAQVNNYRALFGLTPNPPQVIVDGNDPGVDGINSPFGPNGASIEAYLDVEVSGAVAPNAQINLVIADSTALEDGLSLAAQRAVYSNVSPVLSLSFGNCEATLQASGNAFWNSLWEQAAAQGITVTVSSGDSGSAACDDDNSQQYAVRGQAVSGIASTPYNVAVGGTDFYYSGGSADFVKYWNLSSPTTSAATESLTARIPEQPFNSSQFGVDIYPASTSAGTSIFATGGGASTLGLGGTAPYPKPSWQTGGGATSDTVRDLPDVSLFGSLDTNGSYTPICADDGDCLGGSVVQISGVGGTSVAAPEFAGIMALVNQKYGRQGQANYVLYPLATQFPFAFNDVSAGTNTVPCNTQTVYDSYNNNKAFTPIDCRTATPGYTIADDEFGTTLEGQISVTGSTVASYNAGTAYDLASGLGSVDAGILVTNWNKVTLGATTTTLTPSSTTFAHGTAVTISGTVTGSTPTGNVALITTSTDVNDQSRTSFPLLSSGAYSGSVSSLPGGSYTIYGSYPGDSANAASNSTPVSITVTPEASTTTLTVYSSLTTSTGNPLPTSGGSVSYGQPLTISAIPAGTVSKGTSTVPTGSVAFSDGSAVVNTATVNVEGDAEFNAALAPGAHSITAKYSGDGSYTGSTSSAIGFTVAQNTPTITTYFQNAENNGNAVNGQITYIAVSVENSIAVNGLALAPTGTVTVTGAPSGTPASATLVPAVDPYSGAPEGIAYFAVPATATGSYSLVFQYAGDTNYKTTSLTKAVFFDAASSSYLASTVTATATATATSPAGKVIVTATVTGQSGHPAPTGTLQLASTGSSYYALAQTTLPSSSSDSVTVTYAFDSSTLFQGTNQIVLQYFPDQNSAYNASATEVTIANPLSDFSLVPVTTIVSVPNSGATPGMQTDTINLASYNGFAGAVGLTCTASGGVTCSLGTSSATLTSGGAASTTLTVNTSGVTKAGTYNVVVTGTDPTGKFVHTIGLQVVTPLITVQSFTLSGTAVTIANAGGTGISTVTATPASGFTGAIALTCAIAASPAGAASAPTCSPATLTVTAGAVTGPLTFNTTATTTPGTYTVTVTGTAGSVAPTTTVLVTVAGAAVPGTFSLSNSAAITVATQGGTGTSTISVTPGSTNPYTGSVALTCAVSASPSGAIDLPTCSLAPPSVTLAGSALTSTLTINTTAQTTSKLDPRLKGIFTAGGGVALAALLFFGVPVGRRSKRALRAVRTLRILSAALLFAMIAGAGIGCGGGSSNGGGGGTPSGGTTTGAYTIMVTGTPTSGTAQTVTVSVTVN